MSQNERIAELSLYVDDCPVNARGIVSALQEGDLAPDEAANWIRRLIAHNVEAHARKMVEGEPLAAWDDGGYKNYATAQPAPAVQAERCKGDAVDEITLLRQDSLRLKWLCDDHASIDTRIKRNQLLDRVSVMSYSAVCQFIDAALAIP